MYQSQLYKDRFSCQIFCMHIFAGLPQTKFDSKIAVLLSFVRMKGIFRQDWWCHTKHFYLKCTAGHLPWQAWSQVHQIHFTGSPEKSLKTICIWQRKTALKNPPHAAQAWAQGLLLFAMGWRLTSAWPWGAAIFKRAVAEAWRDLKTYFLVRYALMSPASAETTCRHTTCRFHIPL